MREDRQRIDRWLWHARLARTRSAAAELVESGHVRLNGRRVSASSQAVKIDDVLTVALHGLVKVLKVAAFAERRGSFAEARCLYEDLAPPAEPQDAREPGAPELSGIRRERGSGRPTKRDRRALNRMRQRGPD